MEKFKIFIPLILVIILFVILSLLFFFVELHTPYKGFEGEKYFLIKKGEHTGEILDNLNKEGIVKHLSILKISYAILFKKKSIKAGVYLFDKEITPYEVLEKITSNKGIFIKMVLREGLTIEEYAEELSKVTGSKESFLNAMRDAEAIKQIDSKAKTLEGYILPDTYFFAPFTEERVIIKSIVDKFISFWKGVDKEGKFNVRDVVTLASIVEMETPLSSEKSRIAGIFFNRLKVGMPLQSDPTVVYALKRRGLYRGYLLKEDLKFDDPYNSYINNGLPPGPICSPSKETILAVLNPERNNYFYFVSKGDGSHYFSENLESHNKAVLKYIKNGKNRR